MKLADQQIQDGKETIASLRKQISKLPQDSKKDDDTYLHSNTAKSLTGLPEPKPYWLLQNINIQAAVNYLGAINETQESAKLKLLVSEGIAKIMQE